MTWKYINETIEVVLPYSRLNGGIAAGGAGYNGSGVGGGDGGDGICIITYTLGE